MHDEKINRTTDGKGNIKDYTHEELQQFHLENGETIPDLKDVFELIEKHDALANLEFKTDKYEYRGIEEIVLNMAKEYEFKHPLIYSSFNLQTMLRCLAIDKNLDCNWLVDKKISDPKKLLRTTDFPASIRTSTTTPTSSSASGPSTTSMRQKS